MNDYPPKLKIGISIDVFDAVNGGVISTRRITEMLRQRGHEVYVFSTGNIENDPFFIPMEAFYIPFAKKIMQELKMPFAKPVDHLMRPVFKKLDIVHFMFPFWLGYKSLKLARALKKPVVSTFHVQVEHIFKNIHFESDWLIRNGYKWLIGKIYNRTDLVFCPSEFAKSELVHYGLTAPTLVVSNGVSDVFIPKPVIRPKALDGKFIILSVGRLSPEKSHKTIIDAVLQSKYRDRIQLMIFGEGPMKAELYRHAEALPLPLQIELTDEEGLATYYNLADLYIHASELETEGMAPLEASACGTPILVSNSPASASGQFVLDQQFLFSHGNATELSQKIDHWLERPDELKYWGSRYAESAEHYRIEKVVDTLEAQYYALVDKSKNKKELAGSFF